MDKIGSEVYLLIEFIILIVLMRLSGCLKKHLNEFLGTNYLTNMAFWENFLFLAWCIFI